MGMDSSSTTAASYLAAGEQGGGGGGALFSKGRLPATESERHGRRQAEEQESRVEGWAVNRAQAASCWEVVPWAQTSIPKAQNQGKPAAPTRQLLHLLHQLLVLLAVVLEGAQRQALGPGVLLQGGGGGGGGGGGVVVVGGGGRVCVCVWGGVGGGGGGRRERGCRHMRGSAAAAAARAATLRTTPQRQTTEPRACRLPSMRSSSGVLR